MRIKRLIGIIVGCCILLTAYNNCSQNGFEAHNSQVSITDIANLSTLPANIVITESSLGSTSDDRSTLQRLIDRVNPSAGLVEIRLEPRDYHLNCGVSGPEFCLQAVRKGQIRFTGVPGKTRILIDGPRAGFIYVARMRSFEMTGVTIDYVQAPFLQGTVSWVSGSKFEVEVDQGYIEFDHPLLSVDAFESLSPGSYVLSSNGRVKGNVDHWITLSKDEKPRRGSRQRSWLVSVYNANLSSLMAPGDRYVIGPRHSTGVGFLFEANDDVLLKNVTLHTAPFMGVFGFGNLKSVVFDGLQIVPTPGSNRLASTVADAIHLQNNAARVIVKNGHFSAMGDDALNIYAHGAIVGSLAGLRANELRLSVSPNYTFNPGDLIQITAHRTNVARFGAGGEPRLVGVIRETGGVRLTLDQNRSSSIASGDVLFNVSQASVGSQVTNNRYGPFRGSIRMRSPAGVFQNNIFADSRNHRVLTTRDPDFPLEGPITGLMSSEPSEPQAPVVEEPVVEEPAPNRPPDTTSPNWVSVFRYQRSGDLGHAYSLSAGLSLGRQEGAAFKVVTRSSSGLVALKNCNLAGGRQMLSVSSICEGVGSGSILGYISTKPIMGATRPLYRCFHSQYGHLATKSASECTASGYQVEGALGYVP